MQEILQAGLQILDLRTWTDKHPLKRADISDRLNVLTLETFTGVLQQVADLPINERSYNSRLKLFESNLLMATLNLVDRAGPKFHFLEFCQANQTNAQGIVQVVSVVSQAIGGIDDLRLQQGLAGAEEFLNLGGVGAFAAQGLRFQYFPGQIQSGEIGVAIFQHVHDAQAVTI